MFQNDRVSLSAVEPPSPVPKSANDESHDVYRWEFEGKSDADEFPPV
jgi:hypothetical protein